MKYKKLYEIANVIAGQSPPSTTYNTKGEGLPFFQGKADFEDKYPKVRSWCTSKKKKEALPGDILMSVRAPVGPVNICNQKAAIGRGIAAIRPLKGTYGEYLFYFFRANQQNIANLGTGSTFKAITQETLKNIQVPFPLEDDQIRIATLLSRVEALIATRKENLRLLDEFLKSTFLEMFGDPIRNDKGWDKPALKKNFGEISTGNTPPRNNPVNYSPPFIEWIKTDNIDQNQMYLTQASEHLSETGLIRARAVKKGALLVACIAGSIESIGRAALTDRNVAFNQQINAIQPNVDIKPIFLYWLFRISKLYIQSFAPKGMKKILTKGNFEKITMIKPPKDMQDRFALIAEKAETLRSLYQESLIELENLYGTLSQKAFKGELDLSRIPLGKRADTSLQVVYKHPKSGFTDVWHKNSMGNTTTNGFRRIKHKVSPVVVSKEIERVSSTIFHMSDPAAREKVLWRIFEEYFNEHPRRSFSFNDFWSRVEFNVLDHMDEESPPLGVEDYNKIKQWVFEQLKNGQVEQHFNTSENQMELHPKP